MRAEHLDSTLLAWLGTYFVHSTLLLTVAWILGRALSRSRRLSDALPSIRESLWRVALLAGLVTASAQRVLEVDPSQVLWTIETHRAMRTTSEAPPTTPAPSSVVATPAVTSTFVPPVPSTDPARTARRRSETTPARGTKALPWMPIFVPGAIACLPLAAPAAVWVATPVQAPSGIAAHVDAASAAPAEIETCVPVAAPVASLASPVSPSSSGISWPRALLTLWLAGIAAGAALWAREWMTLHRRLRGRVELDRGPVYEAFARLCRRTDTHGVRLTCAPSLSAPITLGLVRSEIVLPPRATTQLSDDELEALFAHELAHARRGDPLWLVIYRALEVVFFFQPLNRIARVRLQDEAELLADDWAATQLAERVSLASCLTEIAGWIVDERRLLPAPGMAARGTRLSVRVRRLLDDEHHPERARRPHGLLLLAGLAVTGVALFGPAIATERSPRSTASELATLPAVEFQVAPDFQVTGELEDAGDPALESPCASTCDEEKHDCADERADLAEVDDDAADASDTDATAETPEALGLFRALFAIDGVDVELPASAAASEPEQLGVLRTDPPLLFRYSMSAPRITQAPRQAPSSATSKALAPTARYPSLARPAKAPSPRDAFLRAPGAAALAGVPVTVPIDVPVDVIGELQRELAELRTVALHRDVSPELNERLDELERDVALLRQHASELGALVQRAFPVTTPAVQVP